MDNAQPGKETTPQEIPVPRQSPWRLAALVGDQPIQEVEERALEIHSRLRGRAIWNVNSTARGGGVAEMLHSLLPYARGMGIDARWVVIRGTPEFFRITKRLHHALHGSAGDGSVLDDAAREVYEDVLRDNSDDLVTAVRPGDVVILHDPQTAGLIGPLKRHGAHVAWRCHIGTEQQADPDVEEGWNFLARYLVEADVTVFSHPSYVPPSCDDGRSMIIHPSIDPFSPKNQDISTETARDILTLAGILSGEAPETVPVFTRLDGSPGRIDHLADVTGLGPPPPPDAPLVVQVSRWDPLKDPVGVILGFTEFLRTSNSAHPHLVLAGPTVRSIPDDPESAQTLDRVTQHWRKLSHSTRARVHLACLPMADLEENAAIVNALQRHAAVIVQKSIHEGFGLTVTEAMWKAKPVIASAVGGILEQIVDEENGLLLSDPRDPEAFAAALHRVTEEDGLATRLGEGAKEAVREKFLPVRHLMQYAQLFDRLEL
jgi:trehalose synthase